MQTWQSIAKNVTSRMRPYWAVSGVYLLLLTALRVVEFFVVGVEPGNGVRVMVNEVVYSLVVGSWIVLAVGVLYVVVALMSRRTAVAVSAALLGLLLVVEVGLTIYWLHNGYLLGCELVARPVAESWMAVKGAVGVVLPVAAVAVAVGGFVALGLWLERHARTAVWAVGVVVVVLALMSVWLRLSNLVVAQYDGLILNKTRHLVVDSWSFVRQERRKAATAVEFDAESVKSLLATHDEWSGVVDEQFPLERRFVGDTFLNVFFGPSATERTPSVVVILVESLGHEFMDCGAMPFVDSLARTGLYWENCLSATTRSYGAIPAITGSVGGPRSFQFGTMPAHNSLVSLLKLEGYNTRSYYAGDYTFDCIYEYLTAQRIDYLSPFYEEFTSLPNHGSGYWWGYNDDLLFDRTIADINAQIPASMPHFSLVTTLSMHDRLHLADATRQQSYEQRAGRIAKPTEGQQLEEWYPACLFTDDCLRRFIHDYSHRPDFQNTIFVITGDHASGRQGGDKLSYHRVPLILWSPLIRQHARFPHVVTHNDIAPAIYSLLASRYGLEAYPTVHWLGDGLDPTPKTLLVVNYVHEITDIIYHNWYYQSETYYGPEKLYTFGSDMKLTPCGDTAALNACRRQLELMKYLYSYTYSMNRLTAHPVYSRQWGRERHIYVNPLIESENPARPPSEVGVSTRRVLPMTAVSNKEGSDYVRVTVEAEVTVRDSLHMLHFPELHIEFKGQKTIHEADRLSKFLTGNATFNPGTYHLSVSKEFLLSNKAADSLEVYITTPMVDDEWAPKTRITLANTCVSIAYSL